MEKPIVIKEIPAQIINERAAFNPFDLKAFIQAPDGSLLQFSAEIQNGDALPTGMICTADGLLTGIPAKDTQGNYEILVTAQNEAGSAVASFVLTIKPSALTGGGGADYLDKIKAQVWEALGQNLPIPDLGSLLDRPITDLDIYYLLERWGIVTIWDAFNLEPPGDKQLLKLEGASQHYNVYDRGSCLVAAPKDLYSHERTIEDGLKTARAMAREVYQRNWTVELSGFEKLTRAAWVEIQHLSDQYGKRLEVINFHPTPDDVKIYVSQAPRGRRGMDNT